jgi:hypothetical protein
MDNVFQELDYSDMSAKHMKRNNKQFNEIDTKHRGRIFQLLISLILLILFIIFFILILSRNSKISSITKEIENNKRAINLNQLKLSYENNKLKEIQLNITNYSNLNENKEVKDIKENIQDMTKQNNNLKNDINELNGDVEELKEKLKKYENVKESNLQKELELLEEQIEKIRQNPM